MITFPARALQRYVHVANLCVICVFFSGELLAADSIADSTDSAVASVGNIVTADDNYTPVSQRCVSDSSNHDRRSQTLEFLQRNCLLGVNVHAGGISPHDGGISPRVGVGGALLKRSATHEACDVPHKCAATHSADLDTFTEGMISPQSCSTAGSASALPVFPNTTLPSFPPTLFSCFPSAGNSRVPSSFQCPPRPMPQVVLPSDSVRLSTSATSTLFSIPVHGVMSGRCPLLLVPSLQNCLLIPSLCSTPLLCVLNPAPQSHNTSAPTTAGIPHVAGNLQSTVPLLSHLLHPVGGVSSSGQLAAMGTVQNPIVASNSQPLPLPNITLVSPAKRPLGGATGSDQLSLRTAAGMGIPHIIRNLQPLSVPNIPILSHPLRPVGGACAVDQSSARSTTSAGIPQIVGNLQSVSVPNVPFLSQPLRPVGGACVKDQSSSSTTASAGIPRIVGNLQPFSVPNIPILSHPLRPVGGACAADQLRASVATGVGIPHVVRKPLSLRLPLPNIPILSQQVRPVGGASVAVDQSAVRLVSSVGGLGNAGALTFPLLSSVARPMVTQPRLNGIISPRSSALIVHGISPTSQSLSFLPASPKPMYFPNVALPRSTPAALRIPTSFLVSTSSIRNLFGHVTAADASVKCDRSSSASSVFCDPQCHQSVSGTSTLSINDVPLRPVSDGSTASVPCNLNCHQSVTCVSTSSANDAPQHPTSDGSALPVSSTPHQPVSNGSLLPSISSGQSATSTIVQGLKIVGNSQPLHAPLTQSVPRQLVSSGSMSAVSGSLCQPFLSTVSSNFPEPVSGGSMMTFSVVPSQPMSGGCTSSNSDVSRNSTECQSCGPAGSLLPAATSSRSILWTILNEETSSSSSSADLRCCGLCLSASETAVSGLCSSSSSSHDVSTSSSDHCVSTSQHDSVVCTGQ